MASPADRDKHASNPTQSPYLFAAFTRFIDDCISNMLQSTVGLPSSLQATPAWRPQMDLGQDELSKNSFDGINQKQADKTGDSVPSSNPSLEAPTSNLLEFDKANIDFRRIHMPKLPWADYKIPDDGIERCSADEALKRLKNYLDGSPYSPVQLEIDPNLQRYAPSWRSAFFDLMNITQGGANYPGISVHHWWHTPFIYPRVWKSLFLKNFSYVYHQNSVHRFLSAIITWPPEKRMDGQETMIDLMFKAQRDDIAHQRRFYACLRELNRQTDIGLGLVELFIYAGDRRPFDDDYEAKYLGRFPTTDATRNGSKFRWELYKEDFNHREPAVYPSIIDQMALLQMKPKPDGNLGQVSLLWRTRFSDGTMKIRDRSNEFVSVEEQGIQLQERQPAKATSELYVDSHDADAQTKVKKGGWFWR